MGCFEGYCTCPRPVSRIAQGDSQSLPFIHGKLLERAVGFEPTYAVGSLVPFRLATPA